MKFSKTLLIITAFVFLNVFYGCEDILNEPVHSELDTDTFLRTEEGILSTLAAGYSNAGNMMGFNSQHTIKAFEMTTDILYHSGGGEHANALLLLNFTWNSSSNVGNTFQWGPYWNTIRNANIVLDNVDNAETSDEMKELFRAEAQFIRAYAYYMLFIQFGSMPIRQSTFDPLEIPRASDIEFFEFMESELLSIIPVLPEPGNEPNYGRAHRAAAQALLTKFYLNNRQWEKTAEIAQSIINEGHYELYPDYNEMFSLENERNNEFIWVKPAKENVSSAQNSTTATALPWDFHEALDGGIGGVTMQGWDNFASQYRIYDEFYYSFEDEDERRTRILTRYVDTNGDTINLLEDFENATRGLKYPMDPRASSTFHGNDIPFVRYAYILLSRAEALNELNGPNAESIELINQVRNRAGLGNIQISDFNSTEELRDHILKERGWEFWYEGKRKQDLTRMGKFVSKAHERGAINAQEYHNLYPIPQAAIDANPLLEQNLGY